MQCVNISTVLLIKTGNILVYNINNIDFLGVTFSNVTWTFSIQENAENDDQLEEDEYTALMKCRNQIFGKILSAMPFKNGERGENECHF